MIVQVEDVALIILNKVVEDQEFVTTFKAMVARNDPDAMWSIYDKILECSGSKVRPYKTNEICYQAMPPNFPDDEYYWKVKKENGSDYSRTYKGPFYAYQRALKLAHLSVFVGEGAFRQIMTHMMIRASQQ